ncbi:putative phage DNA packaging protein [Dictyocaulus viviparus]|uniref:Putative phage DNA packaging protein n=1 Tax=Dictyocaulus viviparus TaxID=29172 RepID=A0A0D8Y9M3_DICVI|nr:putative phage DNA packaging protein [Dictyocaulus viviparus]
MPRTKRKGRGAKAARRGHIGVTTKTAPKRQKRGRKSEDALDEQEKAIKQMRVAAAAKINESMKARQPHSFVIHRGKVGKYVKLLEKDIRQIMDPFTARHLKASTGYRNIIIVFPAIYTEPKILKRNNIKDFTVHGAVLGVTNMIVLTTSEISVQLRMMRFNQGPTLTFRLLKYSLAQHILSTQKRPMIHQKMFEKPPLVVINGFNKSEKKHLSLIETFIQNMFPSINVDTLDLRSVKRCVMVNYWEDDDTIDIRHYAIRVVASGLNKSVRKLVTAGKSSTRKLPDLSKYKDISDYILNPGHLSDSEYEGEEQEVLLSQSLSEGRGTVKGEKSYIRLMEIGPRLSLELLKIEDGIDDGEVLYNKNVQKTGREIQILKRDALKKRKLKKRVEQDNEHRIIRRLQRAKEAKKLEEEQLKAIKEKAARKQAAATGQLEDIENCKEKDREIALNREREMKRIAETGEFQRSSKLQRKRQLEHSVMKNRKIRKIK